MRAVVARSVFINTHTFSLFAVLFVSCIFFYFIIHSLLFHSCVRAKFEITNKANTCSPSLSHVPEVQVHIVRLGRGVSGCVPRDARPPRALTFHFSRCVVFFHLCSARSDPPLDSQHRGQAVVKIAVDLVKAQRSLLGVATALGCSCFRYARLVHFRIIFILFLTFSLSFLACAAC